MAAKRELQRPYEEKKLDLYLDAARVLTHLATSPAVVLKVAALIPP